MSFNTQPAQQINFEDRFRNRDSYSSQTTGREADYPPDLNRQDSGYDQPAAAPAPYRDSHDRSTIPEEVCEYLRFFKRCVRDQNVDAIHNLYEFGFPDLTERYYRDRFWPDEEKVRHVLTEDQDTDLFILLYKELYYRYVYAKVQRGPSLEHRWNSFQNYQALFAYILGPTDPIKLNLPNQWLWDIVDEFVYQFQSFCQFKASPSKRTKEELEDLAQIENQLWNLYPVMNILYSLVRKSQINEQLTAINRGENPDDVADDFGSHPMYYKLGYFSLIGLLRLHVLLGDHFQALKTVENIEFDAKGLFNTVPSCSVTLHYYVGFCHMMMRHYQETVQMFVSCLLYIQRTRGGQQPQQQHVKTWQYDVISKTSDQMYNLLAICLILQPRRIDESVQSQLTEKLSDKMNRMARGELADFESAFQMGCPKFLSPTASNFDSSMNFSKEPTLLQSRVFMEEVKQQIMIPVLRGYLKLYTTMPVAKLASFVDVPENELISSLLSFKHKMCDVSRNELGIEDDSTTDLDFYIDKDMIHVADTKVARRYGEYFIRHIQKLMELNKNLSKIGRHSTSSKTTSGGKS